MLTVIQESPKTKLLYKKKQIIKKIRIMRRTKSFIISDSLNNYNNNYQ